MRFGERGGYGFGAIFTDQREQFTDLPRERAIGIGQVFEIFVRSRAEQRDETRLRGRAFRGGHPCAELFLKTFGPQGLSALPGAGISGDLVVLIIDADGGGVRFDSEPRAHIARRHAVPVAVERQADVFVHERLGRIAVIGNHRRQGPERFGLKTLVRLLAGLAVLALVSDFFQPLPRLGVYVRQIGEGTQRPEVLANVTDGAFDFPFF